MAVKLEDRPKEQVKEQVIDQLIINYSHGVISAEAFERRLDQAMQCECNAQLMALVADLELGKADEQYQRQKDRELGVAYQPGAGQECERHLTVLSSNQRSGEWVVPRQLDVTTVLGSNKLDLTDAIFQYPTVTLRFNSYLSDDKIWIPENVNVVMRPTNILSSLENHTRSVADKQAPTIVLEGVVVLGSVTVGVKRTMKDRFVRFANELKSMMTTGSR